VATVVSEAAGVVVSVFVPVGVALSVGAAVSVAVVVSVAVAASVSVAVSVSDGVAESVATTVVIGVLVATVSVKVADGVSVTVDVPVGLGDAGGMVGVWTGVLDAPAAGREAATAAVWPTAMLVKIIEPITRLCIRHRVRLRTKRDVRRLGNEKIVPLEENLKWSVNEEVADAGQIY
jgi:hypothetical protein